METPLYKGERAWERWQERYGIDEGRGESLETPLNKGILLKNGRDDEKKVTIAKNDDYQASEQCQSARQKFGLCKPGLSIV